MDKFCLKWNDYGVNINNCFRDMREDFYFTNVTLVSQDGKQIEAHKLILSASSIFFKEILKSNKHQHPMIYMKGLNNKDLISILDFVYYGEVNINQDYVNTFLSIAGDLELRGLAGPKQTESEAKNILTEYPSRNIVENVNSSIITNDIQENFPSDFLKDESIPSLYKSKKTKILNEKEEEICTDINFVDQLENSTKYQGVAETEFSRVFITNDELSDTVESMLSKFDGIWKCNICGKTSGHKVTLKRHIESRHMLGSSHPCNQCGKVSKTSQALVVHKSSYHRN